MGVKVSVSLPEDDIEFLDAYATKVGFASRSAALQEAVRLLRAAELGEAYAEAWAEWDAADDADLWDATAADGER